MPESDSHQSFRVTAQERSHPAIRKLARACLAIAREQLRTEPGRGASAAPATDGAEVSHD